MVAMRRHPRTELQVWTSFPPGTHEQVVKLWTELLRRQLGIAGPAGPGAQAADECRAVAQPEAAAAPSAPAGHCLCAAVDAASGAREPREHATAIPVGRASEAYGMAIAA